MIGNHWNIVEFYIEKLSNLIDVDKIVTKIKTPFKIYHALQSRSIIKPENIITIPEVLDAMKLNQFGFLKWAFQDENIHLADQANNFDLKKELLTHQDFKDAIENAIAKDYFNVLELVYKVTKFELELYLTFAFQQGQIHIVK